jgi:DNA-binding IclR family transcriptional regulator
VRAAPSGKLRIGPALVGLAVSSRNDIRHEAGPYLERLSHELRETVDLAVLDAGEVLFIDQYASRRTLRIVAQIGARFPLYATANGKALLAALGPDEALALLPRRLTAITENTVTDRDALLREIDEARRTGIAYDRQEYTVGIAALGTVVRDAVGALAAITVVVPAARFPDGESEIRAALLRTRDEIQAALNGG